MAVYFLIICFCVDDNDDVDDDEEPERIDALLAADADISARPQWCCSFQGCAGGYGLQQFGRTASKEERHALGLIASEKP
jgi:hypothetical protein